MPSPTNPPHRPTPSVARLPAVLGMALLAGVCCAPGAAFADLKLCNVTTGRIGVAIGYQDTKGWTTEGWWTIAGQSCETLLKGRLNSRYYYVHAIDYDRGGEWAGTTEMCIKDTSFTIRGKDRCQGSGQKRSGFLEVDTNDARDWTIRLTDPVEEPKPK